MTEEQVTTHGVVLHGARLYDVGLAVLTLGQERRLRAHQVRLAGVTAGQRVLEIGCGTGSLALAAAAAVGEGGQVHGIDASPSMIERARAKAAREGRTIDFRVAVAEALPFADGSLDVVLASLMLHHLPLDVRRTAIGEAHRVLRPGGRLVVFDFQPARTRVGRAIVKVFSHRAHRRGHGGDPLTDIRQQVAEVGFTGVDGGATGFPTLGWLRAERG